MLYSASSWQLTLGQLVSRSRRSLGFIAISIAVFWAILFSLWRLSSICPSAGFCPEILRHKTNQSPDHQVDALLSPGLPQIADESAGSDTSYYITSRPVSSASSTLPVPSPQHPCEGFPDTSNVLLVMKTGASESFGKVPTHILTNLRCIFDFLIFGDMEQMVAGYHIQDSLDEVREEAKAGNPDFDLYFRQKNCASDQETCNKNTVDNTASQGWALDKYKNIHIAEKTWRQKPNYDWYLYVDADTYVIWPTMIEWLRSLSPKDKWYIGSVAFLGNFPFAHGGSGYLVSHAMMKELFDGKTHVAAEWDLEAKESCCGDYLFSYALRNKTGVEVTNVRPVVNGEKPNTIPYGKDQWCQPIVTMHHVNSEEVTDFHEFESERNFTSPMRFKDIYHRFIEHVLEDKREDWDNLSEDVFYLDEKARRYSDWQIKNTKQGRLSPVEREAHLGFDQCRKACHVDRECLQFTLSQGVCAMGRSIKHGKPRKAENKDEDQWLSGWDVAKIRHWVQENSDCGRIKWPSVHNN